MPIRDKVKKLIETSGNDFHLEVATLLENLGWVIKVAPYYNDPATNKPREIDIIATKKFEVRDSFFNQKDEFVVQIFIECKYIKDSVVIWRRPKELNKAITLVKNVYLLQKTIEGGGGRNHHYLAKNDVAKLGAKAGKADALYEGMNGCLGALIFHRERDEVNRLKVINYPVIVINDWAHIHERDLNSEEGHKPVEKPFQLEVDYSFRDKEGKPQAEYFLIDVIASPDIKKFFSEIEENDTSLLRGGMAENLFNRGQNLRNARVRNQRHDFDYL